MKKDGSRSLMAMQLHDVHGLTWREVGKRMGVSGSGAAQLGLYARARGDRLRVFHPAAVPEIEDFTVDKTPGCKRCGLRGEHECLPASATAFLGRRDAPEGTRYSKKRQAGE